MFLRQTAVSEVIFHDLSQDEERSFPLDASHEVSLKGLPDVQIDEHSFKRGLFQVVITWNMTATRKVKPMFEQLASRRLPDGVDTSRLSFCSGDGSFNDDFSISGDDGRVINLKLFPSEFQTFVTEKTEELTNFTNNFIKILRWRTNVSGPDEIPRIVNMEWSLDKSTWFHLPIAMEAKELEWANLMAVSEEVQKDLTKFYTENVEAPLGQELFYEAWSQRAENPRSSLILGIAALEIGVKECIVTLAPQTKWLVDNLSTPPVKKLLLDYIPTLSAKNFVQGKVVSPPKKLMDEIEKGVNLRNQLVHKGSPPLKYETLRDILLACKDTIWLCNYYMGYEWAWQHIRRSSRLLLDPDAPVEELRVASPLL